MTGLLVKTGTILKYPMRRGGKNYSNIGVVSNIISVIDCKKQRYNMYIMIVWEKEAKLIPEGGKIKAADKFNVLTEDDLDLTTKVGRQILKKSQLYTK